MDYIYHIYIFTHDGINWCLRGGKKRREFASLSKIWIYSWINALYEKYLFQNTHIRCLINGALCNEERIRTIYKTYDIWMSYVLDYKWTEKSQIASPATNKLLCTRGSTNIDLTTSDAMHVCATAIRETQISFIYQICIVVCSPLTPKQ